MIIVGMIGACLTMVVAFVVMTGMIVVIVPVIVIRMIVMVMLLGCPPGPWGGAWCVAARCQHGDCSSHQESSQREVARPAFISRGHERTREAG